MLGSRKLKMRGGQFIDLYNMAVSEDISMTIKTTINSSNNYWVTEYEEEDDDIQTTARIF